MRGNVYSNRQQIKKLELVVLSKNKEVIILCLNKPYLCRYSALFHHQGNQNILSDIPSFEVHHRRLLEQLTYWRPNRMYFSFNTLIHEGYAVTT